MKIFIPLIFLVLISCSKKDDGSHLPSVLDLPGALIETAADNAQYGYTRTKVKDYVIVNYDVLNTEIKAGDGTHLNILLDRAGITTSQSNSVKLALQKDHSNMFKNVLLNTEGLMHIFSSLYLPQEATKTLNGFTYTQASNIVQTYLEEQFDDYRLSLKNKTTQGLLPIVHDLNMQEKQNKFYDGIWKRYEALIIEPVVISVMVHTN